MRKTGLSRKIFVVCNVILLSLFSLICLYPMLYVVFASFSDSAKLLAHEGFLLWPEGFSVEAYRAVAKNPTIVTGYANSIFVLFVGTFFSVFMTALGAYFWTRRNVGMKKVISILFLIPMFFTGGMIPTYLVVKNLGLYNTLGALILPSLVSTYNMVIMRTSFAAIPVSLEEAATIDGANPFRIFMSVTIPLSKAVIAVMILYYGVGYWNAWFQAMIYLNDRSKFPLQLILREILIVNDTSSMSAAATGDSDFAIAESIKYAVIVVATVPILCVYPFLQKYFVKGVMIGAVKG